MGTPGLNNNVQKFESWTKHNLYLLLSCSTGPWQLVIHESSSVSDLEAVTVIALVSSQDWNMMYPRAAVWWNFYSRQLRLGNRSVGILLLIQSCGRSCVISCGRFTSQDCDADPKAALKKKKTSGTKTGICTNGQKLFVPKELFIYNRHVPKRKNPSCSLLKPQKSNGKWIMGLSNYFSFSNL